MHNTPTRTPSPGGPSSALHFDRGLLEGCGTDIAWKDLGPSPTGGPVPPLGRTLTETPTSLLYRLVQATRVSGSRQSPASSRFSPRGATRPHNPSRSVTPPLCICNMHKPSTVLLCRTLGGLNHDAFDPPFPSCLVEVWSAWYGFDAAVGGLTSWKRKGRDICAQAYHPTALPAH